MDVFGEGFKTQIKWVFGYSERLMVLEDTSPNCNQVRPQVFQNKEGSVLRKSRLLQ